MKQYTAKIIVAAHKPYTMPDDEMYLPVHVGAAGKESIGYKPFTLIIYAYLFNDLIMLIFSDRFYETVASMGFVKHLLVTYILYKVLIDKLVVFEYRNGLKIKLKKMCLWKRYSINTNKANV